MGLPQSRSRFPGITVVNFVIVISDLFGLIPYAILRFKAGTFDSIQEPAFLLLATLVYFPMLSLLAIVEAAVIVRCLIAGEAKIIAGVATTLWLIQFYVLTLLFLLLKAFS